MSMSLSALLRCTAIVSLMAASFVKSSFVVLCFNSTFSNHVIWYK